MSNKKPKGLMIFEDKINLLLELDDAQIGKIIRASMRFFLHGEFDEENLDQVERICFRVLRNDIERNCVEYQKRCDQNSMNRKSGVYN